MKNLFKDTLLPYWLGSIALTLLTLVYQHYTGPTYDKDADIILAGKEYDFDLPRTWGGESDLPVKLYVPEQEVKGEIFWRKYPTREEFDSTAFKRSGDTLIAYLPEQPPAGKLEYYFELENGNEKHSFLESHSTVVVRFKGHVPLLILRVHIFLMFASMFLSNMAGILALLGNKRYKFYTVLTMVVLLLGGMVLGPIVQKYAFGVYWSGIPFDWDLTDNKLLFTFLVWFIAAIANWKKERRYVAVIAAVVLILMYAIPHSAMGSELDPETGKLGTSEKLLDR